MLDDDTINSIEILQSLSDNDEFVADDIYVAKVILEYFDQWWCVMKKDLEWVILLVSVFLIGSLWYVKYEQDERLIQSQIDIKNLLKDIKEIGRWTMR